MVQGITLLETSLKSWPKELCVNCECLEQMIYAQRKNVWGKVVTGQVKIHKNIHQDRFGGLEIIFYFLKFR